MNNEPSHRVLLARPTSLIVKHMKKLWTDAAYQTIVLQKENELNSVDWAQIKGVVISTSVLSPIKMDYPTMIKEVQRRSKGIPIFLASFSTLDKARSVIEHNLKDSRIDLKVLSLEEASAKDTINADNEIVVICKEEISDPTMYSSTLSRIKRILEYQRPGKVVS